MSFRYLAWAQSAKTGSPSTKSVLMALCSIVNDDGIGFPSQQRIADDSELSVRSVKRAMTDLEKAGIITRERRYREGGYRTSDLIHIHQNLGDKIAPKKILHAIVPILGAKSAILRCHSGLAEPVIEPVIEPSTPLPPVNGGSEFKKGFRNGRGRKQSYSIRESFRQAVEHIEARQQEGGNESRPDDIKLLP